MKLEELKFPKRKKKKKVSVVRQRSGRQETTMERSGTLSKNPYYIELKPISKVDKEYIDEHESDNEILQCDSIEASVESEESHNEESLNLERVFKISNEHSFLIGHSSRFGRSVKFNRLCLY